MKIDNLKGLQLQWVTKPAVLYAVFVRNVSDVTKISNAFSFLKIAADLKKIVIYNGKNRNYKNSNIYTVFVTGLS